MENNRFDFHADDYALTEHASSDIISLIRHGHADSISILPNMSCFDPAMEMLRSDVFSRGIDLPVSVHLNFMEGYCLSDAGALPDLVDARGIFSADWGGLMKASADPLKHDAVKKELMLEMKAQIGRVREALPSGTPLRIDSHQHTHMIPVVFEALAETIEAEQYPVTFIRNSHEPLLPFLRQRAYLHTYEPVNLLKNRAIAALSGKVEKSLREMKLPPTALCGLVLSGLMDSARVSAVLPEMARLAAEHEESMEILFHPGRALPEEIGEEFGKEGFIAFHLSRGRKVEGKALISLTTEKSL